MTLRQVDHDARTMSFAGNGFYEFPVWPAEPPTFRRAASRSQIFAGDWAWVYNTVDATHPGAKAGTDAWHRQLMCTGLGGVLQ